MAAALSKSQTIRCKSVQQRSTGSRCFSAGETLEEALQNTVEAISGHLEILAEDAPVAPKASDIDIHHANPDYQGATWAYVDVSAFAQPH